MITSSEYRKRLSKMRRNVYMNGQLIDRDHPRLEGAVNVLAKTYDMINDPEFKEYADILTAKSHLTGKKIIGSAISIRALPIYWLNNGWGINMDR